MHSSRSYGLPTPTKSAMEPKQAPNIGGTKEPGWSTKGKPSSSFSDGEGLKVAYMHSELTCIRETVEKIPILPHDLTLIHNSLEPRRRGHTLAFDK